eukprot:scaffold3531_cov235-Ochromonas_danica.AAC.5
MSDLLDAVLETRYMEAERRTEETTNQLQQALTARAVECTERMEAKQRAEELSIQLQQALEARDAEKTAREEAERRVNETANQLQEVLAAGEAELRTCVEVEMKVDKPTNQLRQTLAAGEISAAAKRKRNKVEKKAEEANTQRQQALAARESEEKIRSKVEPIEEGIIVNLVQVEDHAVVEEVVSDPVIAVLEANHVEAERTISYLQQAITARDFEKTARVEAERINQLQQTPCARSPTTGNAGSSTDDIIPHPIPAEVVAERAQFSEVSSVFEGMLVEQKFGSTSSYNSKFIWINLKLRKFCVSDHNSHLRSHKQASLADISGLLPGAPRKYKGCRGPDGKHIRLDPSLCLTIRFNNGGDVDLKFPTSSERDLWKNVLDRILFRTEGVGEAAE